MKTIKMFTTAAGPERVLHAGQLYSLPDKVADEICAGKMVHGQTVDGKHVTGGPCAIEVRGERGRAPGPPDPQEHRDELEDDE